MKILNCIGFSKCIQSIVSCVPPDDLYRQTDKPKQDTSTQYTTKIFRNPNLHTWNTGAMSFSIEFV